VTRKKADAPSVHFAGYDGIGRRAKGRLNLDFFNITEAFNFIKAGAADNSDGGSVLGYIGHWMRG